MSVKLENLPQIIFLYGPAGSGKGTQAVKILEEVDGLKQLEYGGELRAFVAENKDNSESPEHERAKRMSDKMESGNPIDSEDLKYVVKVKILEKLKKGEKILIDGAWRSIAEAEWLADFLKENEINSCIVHVYLDLEEALRRIAGRWYITGSSKPYKSKEDALFECIDGQEPYQRTDDAKKEVVIERYKSMYGNIFPKILATYQIETHDPVFMIDGSNSIDEVFADIKEILSGYYR